MTESIEIWKEIPGYEGKYQVSNLGRVKSLNYHRTGKEKILKPGTATNGYLFVRLCKDGKTKMYTVHRLVAFAFVPNDDPVHKTEVNHLNEYKTENFVWINEDGTIDLKKSNLEWVTRKENNNWGSRNERARQKQVNCPKKRKPIKQISLDGALITIWPSTMEIERKNGFGHSFICECCQGKYRTAYGFKWAYV